MLKIINIIFLGLVLVFMTLFAAFHEDGIIFNNLIYYKELIQRKMTHEKPINRPKCIACEEKNQLQKNPARIAPFIVDYVFGGKIYPCNAVYCKICSMVFFDIAYNDKHMKLLYSDYRSKAYAFFREKYEPGYSNLNSTLVNTIHNDQHINILNLLSTYAPNNKITRILDYGGDRGQVIPPSLKGEKFVYELSGVDAEEGIKKINKLESKYYDFIMCTHVLEHLRQPIESLYEIKNALTDDGIIYIEVPLQLDELNNSQSKTIFMHEHINFFNPKSLKSLLELAGFETIFVGEIAINNFGNVVSALAKKRP